jgi:uncharacterized membrane protein YccC
MRDPGRITLRRALRASVALPIVFAIGKLGVSNPQFTTFAVFGAFALLVFADFSGATRPRVRAYVSTTLVGLGLIAIGTALGTNTPAAVAYMVIATFVLTFVGILGGYFAAAGRPLILAIVLSVSIESSTSAGAYGARLGGWALAGGIATVAAVVLWPHHERMAFRRGAAHLARALADRVAARTTGTDDALAASGVDAAVEHLAELANDAQYRPAGPAVDDRALIGLHEQFRSLAIAAALVGKTTNPADAALADAALAVLRSTADTLESGDASALQSSITALNRTRAEHRAAIDTELRADIETPSVVGLLERITSNLELRIASFSAEVAGTDACIAVGSPLPDDPTEGAAVAYGREMRAARAHVQGVVRTHLPLRSVWCQNAIRAGVAIGLAVLVGRLGHVDHAFWVALGTLSVLRSNALGTERTAMNALVGTVLGFAVAGPFVEAVGGNTTLLWIAFPITVFLAAYTPTVVHFVVGQASFTLLVVVLFNLIDPVGWHVGLVRVQDIALGAAVSLIAVAVLWPRGARGGLRASVERQYSKSAAYLAAAVATALGASNADDASGTAAARATARASSIEAGEAWQQYLEEHGAKLDGLPTWADLIASGRRLQALAGHLLRLDPLPKPATPSAASTTAGHPPTGKSPTVAELQAALDHEAQGVIASCRRVAADLRTRTPIITDHRIDGVNAEATRARNTRIAALAASPAGRASAGPIVTLLWAGELLDRATVVLRRLTTTPPGSPEADPPVSSHSPPRGA